LHEVTRAFIIRMRRVDAANASFHSEKCCYLMCAFTR